MHDSGRCCIRSILVTANTQACSMGIMLKLKMLYWDTQVLLHPSLSLGQKLDQTLLLLLLSSELLNHMNTLRVHNTLCAIAYL